MRKTKSNIMKRTSKVDFGLKINKPIFRGNLKLNKGNAFKHSKKLLNMNWKQIKKRFPGLSPTSDIDFDGTINSRDCKPLDPAKDGIFGRLLHKVSSGKYGQNKEDYQQERQAKKERKLGKQIIREQEGTTERTRRIKTTIKKVAKISGKVLPKKFKKQLKGRIKGGEAMRKIVSGEKLSKSGGRKAGPGRPAGKYKHTSPLTGAKVPATIYYKHLKVVRRRLRTRTQQAQLQQQAVMAKKGIPPQLSRQIIERRQDEIEEAIEEPQEQEIVAQEAPIQAREVVQEQPQQVQVVQQPQQMQRPTPARIKMMQMRQQAQQPRFRVITDIMTGRKVIQQLPKREKWTVD